MTTLADLIHQLPTPPSKSILATSGDNRIYLDLEIHHEPLGHLQACCCISVRYLDQGMERFRVFGDDLQGAKDFYNSQVTSDRLAVEYTNYGGGAAGGPRLLGETTAGIEPLFCAVYRRWAVSDEGPQRAAVESTD